MKAFVAWIIAFLIAKVPPGQPQYGGLIETQQETEIRYESVAEDLAEVIANEPSFYAGDYGLARTATVMLSVAFFESGFSAKVDRGLLRGDGGRSVCLMQVNVGKGRTSAWNKTTGKWASPADDPADVVLGWNADELIADRKRCFLAAHRLMRSSIASCSRLGALEGLRAYASGTCKDGSDASRRRMSVAVRWFNGHVPSFSNDDILFSKDLLSSLRFSPDPRFGLLETGLLVDPLKRRSHGYTLATLKSFSLVGIGSEGPDGNPPRIRL